MKQKRMVAGTDLACRHPYTCLQNTFYKRAKYLLHVFKVFHARQLPKGW